MSETASAALRKLHLVVSDPRFGKVGADDVIALILEERGISRDSVRPIYPDPIASSLDYIVEYEPVPVSPRPGADTGCKS